MSALPNPAATPLAQLMDLREARLEPMQAHALTQVMHTERAIYPWPWTAGNMTDSINAGYLCLNLVGGAAGNGPGNQSELLGYMVAMQGVDEVHLLNITVAPQHQRQGWSRVMLDALVLWARGVGAQWLWLEVRVGNARACTVYEAFGFRRVGQRKAYYPSAHGQREDAIVMSYPL